MKGSIKPMGLYTVDVELGELKVRISKVPKEIEMKRHFKEKKAMKKLVMVGEFDTQFTFKKDKDLSIITKNCRGPYR